jgi:hypothetical protein
MGSFPEVDSRLNGADVFAAGALENQYDVSHL